MGTRICECPFLLIWLFVQTVKRIKRVRQSSAHTVAEGAMKRGIMEHKIQSKSLGVNRYQPGNYVCSCGESGFTNFKAWYRHKVDSYRKQKASV